jgi:hypothetical protein
MKINRDKTGMNGDIERLAFPLMTSDDAIEI